jgi:hypothetical protein
MCAWLDACAQTAVADRGSTQYAHKRRSGKSSAGAGGRSARTGR